MFRQILFLFLICFAGFSVFAQTEKYTAPVKWERYKISGKDVSVLFPKLPIVVASLDICTEQETKRYAAYAEQTVYGLTVTSKTTEKASDYCSKKSKFNKNYFTDRLIEVKAELKEFKETSFERNKLTVSKISGTDSVYWLIDDFDNQRWFEFWVVRGGEEKTEVKNYIESIEINKNTKGVVIGNGADRTLGDETTNADKAQAGENSALRIVLKSQPKYTDAARQTGVQGTFRLKVTFLASGGIGGIAPVMELPYGLTGQAVDAAKKIVFVPARKTEQTILSQK